MRVLRPGPPACGARARVAGERERCGVCGHAPLVTTNPAPLVHSLRLLRRLLTLLGTQRGLPPAANVGPVPGECAWPPDPAPLLCSLLTLSPCCLCWDACTSGALCAPEGEAEGGHSHQGLATAQRGCGTPQECTFQVQSAAQSPRPKRPTPGHCPPPVTQGPVRRTDPQHWREKEVQAPPGRSWEQGRGPHPRRSLAAHCGRATRLLSVFRIPSLVFRVRVMTSPSVVFFLFLVLGFY